MILPTGIIVMIIAVALLLLLRYENSIEEENRLLETSIKTARMYSEVLERRTEKIRRLRHDTLGLLQAIESAGESGNETVAKNSNQHMAEEAGIGHNVNTNNGWKENGSDSAEADTCSDRSEEKNPAALTGMPLPDAIVQLKRKQCRENDIEFAAICEGEIGKSLGIKRSSLPNETDLSLLLQNLLDNAYEANLRIADVKTRAMSLDISSKGKALTVRVSNSLPKGEKPTFKTGKQKPELHGIGMKVIDEVIRKYNGRKVVTQDEAKNRLTIEAILHGIGS